MTTTRWTVRRYIDDEGEEWFAVIDNHSNTTAADGFWAAAEARRYIIDNLR